MRKTCLSVRDWGRDCWCEPGVSDTCGKRFGWQLGALPFGYDHKYTYSNLGYNLKVSEMQAAIGCAQFKKLPAFIAARRKNAAFYLERLAQCEEHIILPVVPAKADPSWFCFPITLKPHIDRREFITLARGGEDRNAPRLRRQRAQATRLSRTSRAASTASSPAPTRS